MTVGLEKENMINKMKMKNLFLLTTLLFGSIVINSQDCSSVNSDNYGEDSVECRKNFSLYTGYLRQKNFSDAALFWTKTQNKCPQLKPNLYANGAYIYKKIYNQKAKEKSSDAALYKDTLYQIYDNWIANFGNCNTTKAALAKDIILVKDQKNFSKSYDLYKEVMEKDPSILKSADIKYFFVYTGMYMLKTGKIECEEFLSNYESLSSICENNINADNNASKFISVQNILDKKLGETPCASCDKLEEIYTNKYNSDPENMEKTRKIFSSLSNNKCTESKLYLTLLDKVLNDPNNPPTAKDLFSAALADYRRKDFTKAEARFKRSLSISDDEALNQKVYEILFDIAFTKKQFKKGFDIAGKLTDKCATNDKQARIIAASARSHGNSKFEKGLIYCLALKFAENSCSKTPKSAIDGWKAQLSPKGDLIMENKIKGNSYNVPYWGQSVELKTRD